MPDIGIPDEDFLRGDVPMTKQEVRILTIAKARLHPKDIIYDIGAGTGSLSIEAARQALKGHVYALERKAEAVALIRANAEKFQTANLTVLEKEAPDGIAELPPCDCVLIGGSGSQLAAILKSVDRKLRSGGRIVLNCITVQTLMQCIEYMRSHADIYAYEAIQVQISRLQQVGPYDMAKALNPIYIVTCWKK